MHNFSDQKLAIHRVVILWSCVMHQKIKFFYNILPVCLIKRKISERMQAPGNDE